MNRREFIAVAGASIVVPTILSAVPIPADKKLPLLFGDVEEGECFWYAGTLHLKIKPVVYYYAGSEGVERAIGSYNHVDPETGVSTGGSGDLCPVNDPRFNPEVEQGRWKRFLREKAIEFAAKKFVWIPATGPWDSPGHWDEMKRHDL